MIDLKMKIGYLLQIKGLFVEIIEIGKWFAQRNIFEKSEKMFSIAFELLKKKSINDLYKAIIQVAEFMTEINQD